MPRLAPAPTTRVYLPLVNMVSNHFVQCKRKRKLEEIMEGFYLETSLSVVFILYDYVCFDPKEATVVLLLALLKRTMDYYGKIRRIVVCVCLRGLWPEEEVVSYYIVNMI